MRLRRSDLAQPGITRRRRGKGFSYEFNGKPLRDQEQLDRVAALVIPPAWRDVWICPDERGHIQAIGVDDAGRRQYRYHDQWRAQRDRKKFAHLAEFAGALPRIRKTIESDLTARGLARERVLAAAARVLDRAAIRIGSEAYAVDDPTLGEATFGLATIRRDHVAVTGAKVTMTFPAKGGADTEVEIEDVPLAAVIRSLLRRDEPSEELLAYRAGDGWRDVRSTDINGYLRDISGIEMTAKDFRTWHGTVAAAVSLCVAGDCKTATARKKAAAAAMRAAASILGNTPAVARASYVDPRLLDTFATASMPPLPGLGGTDAETIAQAAFADAEVWQQAEALTIELLRD
jgi:DNA topoisomerase IB